MDRLIRRLTDEVAGKDAKILALWGLRQAADDDRTRANLKEDLAELRQERQDLVDDRTMLQWLLAGMYKEHVCMRTCSASCLLWVEAEWAKQQLDGDAGDTHACGACLALARVA